MRIGIYGSCRNEANNIYDWLNSVQGADVVCVNDTGSSDASVSMLTQEQGWRNGLRVTRVKPDPMTASGAFNTALAEMPDDLDLVLRLDLDERLQPGWRESLEKLDLSKYECPVIVRPWFDHMGCTYRHTRIHSRHGFHWELPVHEVLVPEGPSLNVDVELTIEHHQDPTKDRGQVLGELQAQHAADPNDLRTLHYLAREYTYRQMWGEAIPLLGEHVASGAFPEECSESWRLLGDAYCATVPLVELTGNAYVRAVSACPRRESYVALADFLHKRARWRECLDAADKALSCTEKSWYFNWPWAWGAKAWDLAALASFYLGNRMDAIAYGQEAVNKEPDDERLRTNLEWYRGEHN